MSRPHLTPPETAPELRSAHEPSNPLLGAAEAYGSELGVYPGSSVGSPAVAVDRLDLLLEHCVEACSLGWGPVSPGIVAGARDAKKSAQHRDRVPSLLRLDEPEGFHRVPSSFAKKAAVDSTGRCNTVGFSVLYGSEVRVWRGWVVQEGCPRQAKRSCGSGGRPGSPSATSPGHYTSLPAPFTGCSKPPAGSRHHSGAGEDVHSPRPSGRRSPAGSLERRISSCNRRSARPLCLQRVCAGR